MTRDEHAYRARSKFMLDAREDFPRSFGRLDVEATKGLLGGVVGQEAIKLDVVEFDAELVPWRGWMLTFEGGSTLFFGQTNDGSNVYMSFDCVRGI